jgi:NAD(P)-dependent dehydrogenase (short-subunit alcohol dehydrogenase family)
MVTQNGPVALLVGAGDAIGAAVARRFAIGGYKIRIARREAAKSQKLVEELKGIGADVAVFSVDARKEIEVQDLFARVEETAGPQGLGTRLLCGLPGRTRGRELHA